jgi:hypothetical protein
MVSSVSSLLHGSDAPLDCLILCCLFSPSLADMSCVLEQGGCPCLMILP